MQKYHDNEWGIYNKNHSEKYLFEMLNLEGAQAGLSWETILKKRDNYAIAFDNWDIEKISNYNNTKIQELLLNDGIVKNKLKIQAVVTNAKAYLNLKKEFHGGLNEYLHSFIPKQIVNDGKQRIITSEISDKISIDLKKRQFKFVGSTIIYAYLQGTGFINDHDELCHLANK